MPMPLNVLIRGSSAGADLVGRRLVTGQAVGTAVLLHLGLVEMPLPVDELVARELLELLEHRVVRVVVRLDDLERPPSRDHVAPDEVPVDPVGEVPVTGEIGRAS